MSARTWWMPSRTELINSARHQVATTGGITPQLADELRAAEVVPEQLETALRDFYSHLPQREEVDDGA